MLKDFTKASDYAHIFIIGMLMLLYYFTGEIDFNVPEHYPNASPIGNWLIEKLQAIPQYVKPINMLLIGAIAWYTNRAAIVADIIPRRSYIAASLVTGLMLFSPPAIWFTGTLIVVLLLVFALVNLMNLFGRDYPYLHVINASMAISLASLILPQVIMFILFLWFAFFTFSVNSWREWIISFVGFVLPYLYTAFAWYWSNNLANLLHEYNDYFHGIGFNYQIPGTLIMITLALILIIFGSASLHFTSEASDKIISTRKRMWITFQFAFVGLLMIIIGGEFIFLLIPVLYLPMAIMVSYSIHNRRSSRIYDILFLLLIISITFNRLGY